MQERRTTKRNRSLKDGLVTPESPRDPDDRISALRSIGYWEEKVKLFGEDFNQRQRWQRFIGQLRIYAEAYDHLINTPVENKFIVIAGDRLIPNIFKSKRGALRYAKENTADGIFLIHQVKRTGIPADQIYKPIYVKQDGQITTLGTTNITISSAIPTKRLNLELGTILMDLDRPPATEDELRKQLDKYAPLLGMTGDQFLKKYMLGEISLSEEGVSGYITRHLAGIADELLQKLT